MRPIPRRAALAALAAAGASACSRVGFLAANLPAAFGPYRLRADMAYGADPQHRVDVYLPQRAAAFRGTLVVFFHGGRWTVGDKADYRFVGAALAAAGHVAVLPNYRHYPRVKLAGFMQDTARATLWAAAHARDFGADPGRLYLMGHSSGAHMVVLAALDTRYFAMAQAPATPRIAGVIGLSGPYDFLPLNEPDLQDMFGPADDYPRSQPIDHVRPDAPPMLLIHGLDDISVWPKNSRNLASALAAQGVPVTLHLYHGLGHADSVAAISLPARHRAPTLADIEDFIGRQPSS